ncbi:hypothetical protein BDQ12DRAFT_242419 [Crucibulum laeve]|uniref:Uncharacterized protein n=1 Tax=Crucibulum laeve TaxID=68775 RepID=A0A5C3M5U9_9AGAR|nr:hypothetical protein BDQ12DRAFT_242419 [Crucibulum laeve]
MWSKISHALKPRQTHDEEPSSRLEVMSGVLEQHPNLSVFHPNEVAPNATSSNNNPSPPGSPSKSASRRGMFKRMSKAPPREDTESMRSPSPFKLPIGLPKKVKSTLDFHGNGSQLSLATSGMDVSRPSQDMARRPSQDMLRPSQDSVRSTADTLRRPSLDMLRADSSRPSQDSLRLNGASRLSPDNSSQSPSTPNFDGKFSSVRSILRDPKTPGTGQNVRFFSRDAYKVISPDQSMEENFMSLPQQPQRQELQTAFLDRLNQASPENASMPSVTRAATNSHKSRPSVAEVFSPLNTPDASHDSNKSVVDMSMSSVAPPATDFTNLFDMSQQLELPAFPPGLDFDVNAPMLDSAVELNTSADMDNNGGQMTSTPYKPKDKGKGKEKSIEEADANKENLEVTAPTIVDEAVFHSKEKPPRMPTPLHDRSQSFSFGQTVFYSMANSTGTSKGSVDLSAAYPSSDLKGDSPASTSSTKSRSRALSDSVFQNMIRSAAANKAPEADINDESSSELVVYGSSEPDPFRADANTYYTPQTMIPVTPPQGAPKHTRKTSKEESIIFSLQTQLALQTELCGQYETDLRARDEMVEILSKKLADAEKEETKRKNALRSWKKKVQELERACRHLEEEVDSSRHESMERSVMDEASGEALRMLHRQIAGLERERGEWTRKEEMLREEVETLEGLVKDRTDDVMNLKEMLWNRDESERELKEGLREAKEQIDMLGNVSVAMIDEELLKNLSKEKEQKGEEEMHRSSTAEVGWQQERAELLNKVESAEVAKAALEEELESVKAQLKVKDDEYAILKNELEAQWEHTEGASEKISALEKGRKELEEERDMLKREVAELEQRMSSMEVEWNESENRKNELEAEVQELWNEKELFEKERTEIEEHFQQEQEHSESLTRTLQEREDRIILLEEERQFATDNATRLEENIRKHNEEIAEYSQRIVQREAEAEQLREEMSSMKREHSRLVGEQARALQEAAGQEDETKKHMEELVRKKAQADVEMTTSKDRIGALKEEVDRLRRQVHDLQQESADKEVKIVQITKQRAQDKEDLQGLNIALDSKQQELELLKRRIGVRGTAGSTPAQASKTAHHRRDSSVFSVTPSISRPPSAMSDSGNEGSTVRKERKISAEGPSTSSKIAALGKSTRINGTPSATSSASKRIEGSMGPPPMKPRASMAGTPTPTSRVSSLTRSSSAKPVHNATPVPHRRVSSATLEQSQSRTRALKSPITAESPTPSVSEQSEKENVDSASTAARRRSLIPAPV